MAATGNEAVILKQLKTAVDKIKEWVGAKLDAPTTEGTSGQVLTSDGAGGLTWSTPAEGTVYTGTSPIAVEGSVISIAEAGEGTQGTVSFASDEDFADYLGIS